MSESNNQTGPNATFSPAELAVLAHLYRGEVYRSTVWRTRLDATTNWAVVGNAVFNATGVRVRDFPITLEKLLPALPPPA
jgi:uncharacterized membrane protein